MSSNTKSAIAFSQSQGVLMSYIEKLNPWCIIRPVSNVQMRIVGRFRRRVDAEEHLKILKRMIPNVPFEIMFDIAPEDTDSEDLTPQPPSLQGKGEPEFDSPLLAGEGLGERSSQE
jgi:hypothetical protein